jgi:hypothetical protein
MGGKNIEEQHKLLLYARISRAFEVMVPLCIRLKNKKGALNYLERSKSRAFLDLLAGSSLIRRSTNESTDLKSLFDDEISHLTKFRAIQLRHLTLEAPVMVGTNTGTRELTRISKELNEIYDKIEKIDPEYVSLRRGGNLSLNEVEFYEELKKWIR